MQGSQPATKSLSAEAYADLQVQAGKYFLHFSIIAVDPATIIARSGPAADPAVAGRFFLSKACSAAGSAALRS